jgi:hypothetical protein
MIVSITNAQVPNALMRRPIQAGGSGGGLRSAPTVMNVPMNSADAADEDRVIDELASVPLHRLEAGAHFGGSDCAGGSGGGRSTSAMVKPSATITASAGHSRRWTVRCPRVMVSSP